MIPEFEILYTVDLYYALIWHDWTNIIFMVIHISYNFQWFAMQIFSGISWSGAWLHWFTRCFSEFRWPIEPHGGSRAPSSGRGPRCSALSSALQYVSIDRSCWMKTDEELYSARHWPIWSVRLVDAFLDSRPQVAKDTIAKVHTVQHSNWNEQQTHSSELNYVKANTDYIRIKVVKPMKHGMELDNWMEHVHFSGFYAFCINCKKSIDDFSLSTRAA